MLGVNAELAAVAPADFARESRQRIDDGAQKRGFALAVVADDGGAHAVIDFQVDVVGHVAVGIADGQLPAAERGAVAPLDLRSADVGNGLVGGSVDQFQSIQLLAFRASPRGRAGPGFVFGDELFQVAAFGQRGGVGALLVQALLVLIFQEGVDFAGEHGQLATRQIERVVAGGG